MKSGSSTGIVSLLREVESERRWTGPLESDVASVTILDGAVLVAPVPPECWPYGPPSHHEDCCRLHDRGLYCDCKASDASDAEYGEGHGPPIGAKP